MYSVIISLVKLRMKQRVISAIVALLIAIPVILIGSYAYYVGVAVLAIIGYIISFVMLFILIRQQ